MEKYFDHVEDIIEEFKEIFHDNGFIRENDFRLECYKFLKDSGKSTHSFTYNDIDLIRKRCIDITLKESLTELIDGGIVQCSFEDGEVKYSVTKK